MPPRNSTSTTITAEPDICYPGGKGLLLPLVAEENDWNRQARAFMYFALLSWCFLGVAIIADIFMSAIEAITSKRRHYQLDNGESITVRTWNATVANLTLMALGSSAPEILLNVIEILSEEFYAGELGPSTIVGSAAFNLLVIIAVCLYVIPSGEARTIGKLPVFLVTGFFSVFAYVWLLFILVVVTPDMVDLWEGIITFAFFPILVVIAYFADIGWLSCMGSEPDDTLAEAQALLRARMMETGVALSIKDAKVISKVETEKQAAIKSKAARRVETGIAKQSDKTIAAKDLSVGFLSAKYAFPAQCAEMILELEKVGPLALDSRVGIEYATIDGTMKSADGHFKIVRGYAEIPVGQQYGAICLGQAPEIPQAMKQEFDGFGDEGAGGDSEAPTALKVQPAPFFHVQILSACKLPSRASDKGAPALKGNYEALPGGTQPESPAPNQGDWPVECTSQPPTALFGRPSAQAANPVLGESAPRSATAGRASRAALADEMGGADRIKVNILPDHQRTQVDIITGAEGSGQLRFESLDVKMPGPEEDTVLKIKVHRFNGSMDTISCHYVTEADTGRAGYDYIHTEGDLEFGPGVMQQTIEVMVKRKGVYESKDSFYVILSDLPDKPSAVVQDASICQVYVMELNPAHSSAERMMRLLDKGMNIDQFLEGNKLWMDQFKSALRPGAGDEEEVEGVSAGDWTLHIVSLPWKLLFACVPPATYCGGWLCFFVALTFIGGVTAVIGDLANLMGCCMQLPSQITAITIVALGTSLPDTFASKVAAVEDPTADAAIGNVTGSNSVNVFLGLGLPWMIAAIYWEGTGKTDKWRGKYPVQDNKYPSGGFVVLAGDLGFTVIAFVMAACMNLLVIMYRRRAFQAELGGPTGAKINTAIFFVLLWFFYVSLASWKILAGDVEVSLQVVAILVGLCSLAVAMAGLAVVMKVVNLYTAREQDKWKEVHSKIDSAFRGGLASNKKGCDSAGALDSVSGLISQIRSHINGLDSLCNELEAAPQSQVGKAATRMRERWVQDSLESGSNTSGEKSKSVSNGRWKRKLQKGNEKMASGEQTYGSNEETVDESKRKDRKSEAKKNKKKAFSNATNVAAVG